MYPKPALMPQEISIDDSMFNSIGSYLSGHWSSIGLFTEITYGAAKEVMEIPESKSPLGSNIPKVIAARNSALASEMSRNILSIPTSNVNWRGGWVNAESIIQT